MLCLKVFICLIPIHFASSDFRCSNLAHLLILYVSMYNIVKLRSRFSRGPFLVHSRSILSNSKLFQFQIRWYGPGADAIFTVPPPRSFSIGNAEPKLIQTDFWPRHLDNTMKAGVLNIPAPVRMTPYHPGLQLPTLWIGVILTGKMTFWGDKFLTKVDHSMKIGVLNIPAPVRMTSVLPDSNSRLCG